MEDSAMDVESMGPLRPQTFLFGNARTGWGGVSLGAGAKDELHVIEAEALDYEGNPIKATLASLKMSVQPTVSLGGFEITPPVVLRLKCGSGPVYVSGQHLVALEEEPESDDEEDDVKMVNPLKRPAGGATVKTPQVDWRMGLNNKKKCPFQLIGTMVLCTDVKYLRHVPFNCSDDEDFFEDEEEEKTPVKKPVRDSSAKNKQKSKQNGKDSKPSTPAKSNTPASNKKEKKPPTPKSPKGPLSLEEIKAKMQATVEKGTTLPKLEAKFVNYVKNCFRTQDQKVIQALWQWRQTL
ncbi:PREDICTED: nucleophosmin [Crocodylus porosus]|uniref:nucleophosmin n=1 Tax=Crocodylus porosus TaxID=8502 RepID=UPI00093CD472|nr:PREDICTED: nucleophosmin [Crocodylus porosus]